MVNLTLALPLAFSLAAPEGIALPESTSALPVHRAQAIDNRVTRTSDLPTLELQNIRRRMLADQYISFDEMRRLADAGDGNAAYQYGERLLALDDPDVRSAAALYFASAGLTGRDYAVYELVKLLRDPDLPVSEARLQHLENAMRNLALQGSERAVNALADFYASGEPFGRKPEEVREIMIERAENGDAEAAMDLVRDMMSGETEGDPAQIRSLLTVVREEGDLGMSAAARTLLARLDTDTPSEDTGKETVQ
jgi:TPR repeat protein